MQKGPSCCSVLNFSAKHYLPYPWFLKHTLTQSTHQMIYIYIYIIRETKCCEHIRLTEETVFCLPCHPTNLKYVEQQDKKLRWNLKDCSTTPEAFLWSFPHNCECLHCCARGSFGIHDGAWYVKRWRTRRCSGQILQKLTRLKVVEGGWVTSHKSICLLHQCCFLSGTSIPRLKQT